MLSWPSVAWTSGSVAPRSIAWEPWAWRSQCGDTNIVMPAFLAARLTIPLTARSVSFPPPLRFANTRSSASASLRQQRLAHNLGQQHLPWPAALADDRQLHFL